MQRILVIGCPGAGKSTFSIKLAQKLQLPLIHLDRLYWCGQWQHLTREDFDRALQLELEKPSWVIDGNFNRTIPHRLQYCDTLFYLDLPVMTCLWGITRRIIANYGKTRQDMGGQCVERFDKQKIPLYKDALSFKRTHRKSYIKLLENTPDVQVIIFKTRRQVNRFLKTGTIPKKLYLKKSIINAKNS